MNILYLHAHDAGRFIQPYGYAIPTPHLMNLAREGTLFRQAYCCGPTCSPSRSAMLTGVTARQSGMTGLAHRGFSLNDPGKHLAAFLRRNGYETVLSGVQHEFTWKAAKPYDKILPAGGEGDAGVKDRGIAEQAAAYLKEPKDRPFFLSCGFNWPHRVFPEPDADLNPAHILPPPPMPDTPETRRDMAAYMSAVRSMDACCGIVLDALKEASLEDDTMVIFTVDHGIAFPRMKCNLYDTGTGVSFIVKYPGNPMAGKACDALVSHLDVYPTVCDYLKLEPPEWLQGHSLRPLFEGKTTSVRDEIFSEVTYHAAYEPMRCIRTERYKLIRFFDEDRRRPMANIDASPCKTLWMENGWADVPREETELYDLLFDPHEQNNLAASNQHQDIRKDLEKRLRQWMEETEDPLLKGPVPMPPGAKVNTRESIDPAEGPFEKS